MKPTYTHDCDSCQFLGTVNVQERVTDLYYCGKEPTLIARYSSEGSDYASGLCFGQNSLVRLVRGEEMLGNVELMVAYVIAKANGFNVTDKYSVSKKSLKQLISEK